MQIVRWDFLFGNASKVHKNICALFWFFLFLSLSLSLLLSLKHPRMVWANQWKTQVREKIGERKKGETLRLLNGCWRQRCQKEQVQDEETKLNIQKKHIILEEGEKDCPEEHCLPWHWHCPFREDIFFFLLFFRCVTKFLLLGDTLVFDSNCWTIIMKLWNLDFFVIF